jgi:hypothetical protein
MVVFGRASGQGNKTEYSKSFSVEEVMIKQGWDDIKDGWDEVTDTGGVLGGWQSGKEVNDGWRSNSSYQLSFAGVA